MKQEREYCNVTNGTQWIHCSVCNGRVHNERCTTSKIVGKDCFENHSIKEWEKVGF